MTVPNNKTPFYSKEKGVGFTQSLWLYINDWNYRYREEKVIFEKGEFEVYVGSDSQTQNKKSFEIK